MISRRAFGGTLALGLLVVHGRVRAQPAAKAPRVGWLSRSAGRESPTFKAFTEGLRELGHVIGETVIVDVGAPERDEVEQYAAVAARLVAAGVDIIVAANPHALEAVTKATRTIPIIGVDLESDPVAKGWAAALARPGGNVTGLFLDIPEMSGKQLQFLKEVKPNLARVAVLWDPRVNQLQLRATEVAAGNAGLSLQPVPVKSLDEISGAIAAATRHRAGALLVLTSPIIFTGLPRIAEATVKHRLPAINLFVPFFAEAGGLLAYGPTFSNLFRHAADYVDRIIKGAKVGDLPVQRPTKFELVVNLRTAKAMGLTIPPSLLLRATRVIE